MSKFHVIAGKLVRKDGRLALGCNCCGPGCTDDGTLYGLLEPCSDQIDCDGNPVAVPCLVLAMSVLPTIGPGQKYFIYGTCYTLKEANKTRCQLELITCGGRSKNYAKVPADDIEVISAACTDEVCLPGRVAEYAVFCDGTVKTDVKYCTTDGCRVAACVIYGGGPVARVLPGETAVRNFPAADSTTCCSCFNCFTGNFWNGTYDGNGSQVRTTCCCGKPGDVCTYTLTASDVTTITSGGVTNITSFNATSTGGTGTYAEGECPFVYDVGTFYSSATGETTTFSDQTRRECVSTVCAGQVVEDLGFNNYVSAFVDVLANASPGANPYRNRTCTGWTDAVTETFSTGTRVVTLAFTWSCPTQPDCVNGCGGGSAASLPAGVGFGGLLPL